MNTKTSLKNLITALGGSPASKSIKGLLGELVVLEGGTVSGKTTASMIQDIAVAKGYVEPTSVPVSNDKQGAE